LYNEETFEVFTTVNNQAEVFCIVMPCSVEVGYKNFGETSCLHLQEFTLKMGAAVFPETLLSTATLHGITTRKN
jgi:hypothetical protein